MAMCEAFSVILVLYLNKSVFFSIVLQAVIQTRQAC